MKKFRPFLALLLACWLLAVPALADDEVSGDTSESPPASDDAGDSGSPAPEEPESPPPAEDPPAAEDPPPAESPPDDTPSVPPDTPPDTENPAPVPDPDPVDPSPEVPTDPLPENPNPEAPTDPLPENPNPEAPVTPNPENPNPEVPVTPDPETPVVPPAVNPPATTPTVPPSYRIPDTSLVPGTLDVPTDTAPVVEEHQVFTVTTIPEFARAALDSDVGNTMASVVRDLFGRYTPKVQTVSTYVDGELVSAEEQYVPGVAGMDWEWIAGFAVFLLMVYCLFRLLGGSVKYG